VGWALGALREGSDVPWQRVINARGEISTGHRGDAAATQRILLEAEGVVFDQQGRVDLARYQWPGLDWPQVEALHAAWNIGPPASG
jgi:methylated-DNA-protein-cysteine methyltransferase-like protein